jgi:uncharacterized repeat protein (TIGR01451 family)
MKTPLGLALLVLVASAATTFAQLPDPRPDLVIAGIVTSEQRVGVGETFFYAVTARNAGRTPCNFVNLTLKLPGEVDLNSASSAAPLACSTAVIRVVGEPFDVACKGGPGFFLWPGNTVTAGFFVRGLRAAGNVTATAVVDPDNVCFESNESNNRATSAAVTIIQRPSLKMTLNKPFTPPTGSGRGPRSQIFPVTITNTGAGPAVDIALVINQPFIVAGATYNGPEIDIAYKGERFAEGHVPTNLIPPSCGTTSAGSVLTRTCILHIGLQPGELLQVHYRATPCGGTTPVAVPDIRVSTADDLTQADHVVNLHRACAF